MGLMRNVKKGTAGLFIVFLLVTTSCAQTPIPKSTPENDFGVTLPQRAYWNSKVTVSAEASPGMSCKLNYITPAGTISEANGLGHTIANANGVCSWTWIIGESKKKGSGRVIVTINGVSETHFFEVWPSQ